MNDNCVWMENPGYLCAMKNHLFTIAVLSSVFSICPVFAQFYTIGNVQIRRVEKKKDHLSELDSQMDSLSLDSLSTKDISYQEERSNISMGVPLLSLPLKEISINSSYGMRYHPVYHKKMMHRGIDLKACYEVVYSMFPGKVVKVGYDERSGKYVTVKTGDYTISYCHLSEHYVCENDYVEAGSIIACSGNTGASSGPHLHLTTKKDGKAFNPVILLDFIVLQKMN